MSIPCWSSWSAGVQKYSEQTSRDTNDSDSTSENVSALRMGWPPKGYSLPKPVRRTPSNTGGNHRLLTDYSMKSRGKNGVASSLWSKPKVTQQHRKDLNTAVVDSKMYSHTVSFCLTFNLRTCCEEPRQFMAYWQDWYQAIKPTPEQAEREAQQTRNVPNHLNLVQTAKQDELFRWDYVLPLSFISTEGSKQWDHSRKDNLP